MQFVFKTQMYADDTTLTTFAEDPCVLEHKMNRPLALRGHVTNAALKQ